MARARSSLAAQVGPELARRMWDVSIDALDWVRERVARHAIDCDLNWGHLHAATKPRQREELLELQRELAEVYDYQSPRFLERHEIEGLLATQRYCAGLFDPRSGHLHPLNYTLGLARAAAAAGVTIFESSPATRIERGDPARVVTAHGTLTARFVVLTRGGYVAGLRAGSEWRVMPVGTYVVATESLGAERITALIRENVAVADIELRAGLFPPLRRSPFAVRRPGQLLRHRHPRHRPSHARADAAGLSHNSRTPVSSTSGAATWTSR